MKAAIIGLGVMGRAAAAALHAAGHDLTTSDPAPQGAELAARLGGDWVTERPDLPIPATYLRSTNK